MDEHPFLSGPLTHAGGVVYRVRDSLVDILLVRAKPAPHDWVFPKGHIEEGETEEACARREVQEEAGVDAIVEDRLGEDRYVTPQGKCVRAVFFLMRRAREVPAAEGREVRWVALEDALAELPFDGAQRLLQTARRMLMQRRFG